MTLVTQCFHRKTYSVRLKKPTQDFRHGSECVIVELHWTRFEPRALAQKDSTLQIAMIFNWFVHVSLA